MGPPSGDAEGRCHVRVATRVAFRTSGDGDDVSGRNNARAAEPDDGRTARCATGPCAKCRKTSRTFSVLFVCRCTTIVATEARPGRAQKNERPRNARAPWNGYFAPRSRVYPGSKSRDGGVSDTHTCFATRCAPSNFIIGVGGSAKRDRHLRQIHCDNNRLPVCGR